MAGGGGELINNLLVEDQAKAQDDENLDEEHESVSEAQEKLEEVCISIWKLNQYFHLKHDSQFHL